MILARTKKTLLQLEHALHSKKIAWVVLTIIVIAAALLRIPYHDHAFFYDEVWRANLISATPMWEAMQQSSRPPLSVGIALVTRLLVELFGNTESSYRVIAMIGGILLPVVGFLVARYFSSTLAGIIFALLLCVFAPYIDYSIEFKPFIVEAMFSLLLLLQLQRVVDTRSAKQKLRLALLLVVTVVTATPCVFFFPGIFLALLVAEFKRRDWRALRQSFALALVLLIESYTYYVSYLHRGTSDWLVAFWKDGFPADFSASGLSKFTAQHLSNILTTTLFPFDSSNIAISTLSPIWIASTLLLIASMSLIRTGRGAIVFAIFSALGATWIFSLLGMWPFSANRMNYFLFTPLSLLFVIGLANIAHCRPYPRLRILGYLGVLFFLAIHFPFKELQSAISNQNQPYRMYMAGMRPAVEWVKPQLRNGDVVAVYHFMAKEGFEYYYKYYNWQNPQFDGAHSGVTVKVDDRNRRPHRDQSFFESTLGNGSRLWIFIMHGMSGNDVRAILAQAGNTGIKLVSQKFPKVNVFLFQPPPGKLFCSLQNALSQDLDCDSNAEVVRWDALTAEFSITLSQSNAVFTTHWGLAGDVPFIGDYDGDRKVDFAVWRPANGNWYILTSSTDYEQASAEVVQFGLVGDLPLQGDTDGDTIVDLMLWRPATSQLYVRQSSTAKVVIRDAIKADDDLRSRVEVIK